jgi:hypothetical protein
MFKIVRFWKYLGQTFLETPDNYFFSLVCLTIRIGLGELHMLVVVTLLLRWSILAARHFASRGTGSATGSFSCPACGCLPRSLPIRLSAGVHAAVFAISVYEAE